MLKIRIREIRIFEFCAHGLFGLKVCASENRLLGHASLDEIALHCFGVEEHGVRGAATDFAESAAYRATSGEHVRVLFCPEDMPEGPRRKEFPVERYRESDIGELVGDDNIRAPVPR